MLLRLRVKFYKLVKQQQQNKNKIVAIPKIIIYNKKSLGKIQGDGRKFLDVSYFGSQISSQSLNEVHIYQLHFSFYSQNLQQKVTYSQGELFFPYNFSLSLTVSSWCHTMQMANKAEIKVLLGKQSLLSLTSYII